MRLALRSLFFSFLVAFSFSSNAQDKATFYLYDPDTGEEIQISRLNFETVEVGETIRAYVRVYYSGSVPLPNLTRDTYLARQDGAYQHVKCRNAFKDGSMCFMYIDFTPMDNKSHPNFLVFDFAKINHTEDHVAYYTNEDSVTLKVMGKGQNPQQ